MTTRYQVTYPRSYPVLVFEDCRVEKGNKTTPFIDSPDI